MDGAEAEVQESQQIREEQRRGSIVPHWVGWVGVFAVVYLLSRGPVAKLDALLDMPGKFPRAEKVLEVIYEPMVLLIERYPPAGHVLMWYLRDVWRIPPSVR